MFLERNKKEELKMKICMICNRQKNEEEMEYVEDDKRICKKCAGRVTWQMKNLFMQRDENVKGVV